MTPPNPLKSTRIEFHILQSFPVTCLNRDDVGAPKTAMVGGVPRARVSSQAWKRPVRLAMQEYGVNISQRTLLIHSFLLDAFKQWVFDNGKLAASDWVEIADDEEDTKKTDTQKNIESCIEHIVKTIDAKAGVDEKTGLYQTSALFFMSNNESQRLVNAFSDYDFSVENIKNLLSSVKEEKKIAKKEKNKEKGDELKIKEKRLTNHLSVTPILERFDENHDGLDIALFGRMAANAASLNIEAACSFAHAISTHKVANEVEFFTAVDDDPMGIREDSGSAHMGSLEFNSATYYRYVSLDLGQLYQTLKGQNMASAIESFVKALYVGVPTARQTTMTGLSAWDYAKVLVRKGQALQASFDSPVKAKGEGYLVPSIEALKADLAKKQQMAGSLFGQLDEIELPPSNIDELIEALKKHLPAESE